MSFKKQIETKIANGYAETHVGYHANMQEWNGHFYRGCYAQIAQPYGGTQRIYAHSYEQLLEDITNIQNDLLEASL